MASRFARSLIPFVFVFVFVFGFWFFAPCASRADGNLPIEVLGAGLPATRTIKTATLSLPAAAVGTTSQLWITCHRCGFYGSPEFESVVAPSPMVKASVRVAADFNTAVPRIDIDDTHVTLDPAERIHGGRQRGTLYHAVQRFS
jgi:hypothetical protein